MKKPIPERCSCKKPKRKVSKIIEGLTFCQECMLTISYEKEKFKTKKQK